MASRKRRCPQSARGGHKQRRTERGTDKRGGTADGADRWALAELRRDLATAETAHAIDAEPNSGIRQLAPPHSGDLRHRSSWRGVLVRRGRDSLCQSKAAASQAASLVLFLFRVSPLRVLFASSPLCASPPRPSAPHSGPCTRTGRRIGMRPTEDTMERQHSARPSEKRGGRHEGPQPDWGRSTIAMRNTDPTTHRRSRTVPNADQRRCSSASCSSRRCARR